jgi:hypothetical protein
VLAVEGFMSYAVVRIPVDSVRHYWFFVRGS